MLSFATARVREFAALLAQYGITISVAGASYSAIGPPAEVMKAITVGAFDSGRTCSFQMKFDDFVTAFGTVQKAQRASFQFEGATMEVRSVNFDPVEPSVELRAALRQ